MKIGASDAPTARAATPTRGRRGILQRSASLSFWLLRCSSDAPVRGRRVCGSWSTTGGACGTLWLARPVTWRLRLRWLLLQRAWPSQLTVLPAHSVVRVARAQADCLTHATFRAHGRDNGVEYAGRCIGAPALLRQAVLPLKKNVLLACRRVWPCKRWVFRPTPAVSCTRHRFYLCS